MKKFFASLVFLIAAQLHATVYTLNSGMSTATLQSNITTAASGSGNTVQFTAGTYALTATLNTPCTNGIIYQGTAIVEPNISNVPSAVFTGPSTSSYSMSVPSNGTGNTSFASACRLQYLAFSGQHGGIFVNYPSSGITFFSNYFTLNDGAPAGQSGPSANSNIYLSGACPGSGSGAICGASLGISYVQVLNNVFYNQCARIRAQIFPDSGALCNAVFNAGSQNHSQYFNNIIEYIEEGFKWNEVYFQITNVDNSVDVEYNNCHKQSRICFENQAASDNAATSIYAHNSMYDPGGDIVPPAYNTFALSLPFHGLGFSAIDNTFSAGAFTTVNSPTNSGNQYGVGLEAAGQNSVGHYNTFFNGNYSGHPCISGGNCQGWNITMFEPNAGEVWTNNYFSGTDTWSGTANYVGAGTVGAGGAISIECLGSSCPTPGVATVNPNTVVQTSVNLTSGAVTISPSSGSGAQTVTLAETDVNHAYTIFYTTDGTTPVPFVIGSSSGTTQVYGGPFSTPAGGATVKAIAQWGQGANQGIVFPVLSTCSGVGDVPCNQGPNGNSPYTEYGWLPSAVASATYTSSGAPTLTSCSQTNALGTNSIGVGGTVQQIGKCFYASVPVTLTCSPSADTYGDVVTAWGATGNVTIGAVGMSNAGVVAGNTVGSGSTTASVGATSCSSYSWTVTAPTLTGVSISVQSGTSLTVGGTAQACATMTYSGFSPTVVCGAGPDAYGTTPFNWLSSSSAATISASGFIMAVSAGTSQISVSAGSIPYNATPLGITINALPPPVPASVLGGTINAQGSQVIN